MPFFPSMFSAHLPHSPSPSPPSSPPPCIDSSPANSPSLAPMILDNSDTDDDVQTTLVVRSVPSSRVLDPFAASAVPDWIPPQYEQRSPGSKGRGKRARDPLTTSPGSAKKMKYHYRPMHRSVSSASVFGLGKIDLNIHDNEDDIMTIGAGSEQLREEQIWEDASIDAFNGVGNIDLKHNGLTYISQKFIEDLENIYIPPVSLDHFRPPEVSTSPGNTSRPFSRSLTAPADIEDSGSYPFLSEARRVAGEGGRRVRTISDMSLGFPKGDIALYLTDNKITKLPKELFNLQKLAILSIMNNGLTYIPPEIRYLTRLHTLNIANNHLRYLPSEMLDMTLKQLNVHPNPFLEPAATLVQPTHPLPRVIPLVEICLRKLLSPNSKYRDEPILAVHYELPLRECGPQDMDPPPLPGRNRISVTLPPHLRKALDACFPGSVYDVGDGGAEDNQCDDDNITGLGYCPCAKGKVREGYGVFVRHGEERFSWESRIGNAEVGARVPVRWRGCNWGCLEFLDEAPGDKSEEAAVRPLDVGSELGFDD